MKRTALHICSSAVMFFCLAVVAAQAQTATAYRGHIPFDFNIGPETYKAGDYIVALANPHSDQRTLLIRNAAGGAARMVMMIPRASGVDRQAARLVFNRSGAYYVLAELRTPTLNAEFLKAGAERRLADRRDRQTPQPVTVGLRSQRAQK